MDKLTLIPTAEQLHILSLITGTKSNILINALAGSGKTATLQMIQAAATPPVLCLAFNKRIADKMKTDFLSTTTVKTLNSLGHGIWSTTCSGRANVDAKKTQVLLSNIIDSLPKPIRSLAHDEYWPVVNAVALAKSLGYIPEGKYPHAHRLITRAAFFASLEETPSELAEELVDTVLFQSIRTAYTGNIDFNDQIYMPALFGGTFPKFPLVLVDEAQDLSPVNHEMLGNLRHSRLIAVGDPWQSIYHFRGSVRQGMALLRSRFEMIEANLSVSFRCPEAIVRAAHWRVPTMRWTKSGGRVAHLRNPSPNSFPDGCAIICRNNAPLFALAIKLLVSGRSVSVSGSEIGPRIIGIMKHLGPEAMTKSELEDEIEKWRAEKLAKESKTADDIASCMAVFASFGHTLGQAIRYAEHLFEQKGTLSLLTGHKAKGHEWPIVYHLDPFLLDESEQDLNLRYVIQTRAMESYFEIESREIQWA